MADLPTVSFHSLTEPRKAPTLILLLPEGEGGWPQLTAFEEKAGSALARATRLAEFKGKKKQMVEILAPAGLDADRLVLFGVGKVSEHGEKDWLELGGALRAKLAAKSYANDIVFDGLSGSEEDAPVWFAQGFLLRSYSFKKYKSKPAAGGEEEDNAAKEPDKPVSLHLFSAKGADLAPRFEGALALAEAVNFARDLVNEPPNVLTPPEFAARLKELEGLGLTVELLDDEALRGLGMRAMLAVGQGSAQPTYAVVLRWRGDPSSTEPPAAVIGKGVCFDSGGISIKPGQGMEEMKGDMAGAAAVAGALMALAKAKAKVNAIGLVGLVENMPSGTAQRPGDIVKAASGKTIEVLNTDAEGRMVLADLIWYAQSHLGAKKLVTLATLTGAIIVALGKENAGLFSNDDALAQKLTEAGLATGETLWRLPLSKRYNKLIDSKIADVKNVGDRGANSITAAEFLQRFVEKGTAWAHLDIAGTAMASPTSDINASWGSGYGVRLLARFLTS